MEPTRGPETTNMLYLLIVFVCCVARTECICPKIKDKRMKFPLTIGVLRSHTSNYTIQRTLQENLMYTGIVEKCFDEPHFIVLQVQDTLQIETDGWRMIGKGMNEAVEQQGGQKSQKINLIIGPFYTNLAMILDKQYIPYLVTDYKGFDKIDMSRVQDRTNWRTLVELRPPAQEQNLAVVDLFELEKWISAVMIMPKSESDNQECQDLAQQMVASGVSVIPYTIDPTDPNVDNMTKATISNSELLNQKQIVVCSPRDAKDKLIERVLVVAKLYNLLMHEDQNFIFVDSSSNLKPLAGAEQMYRFRLFSARCKLLAFRYFTPDMDGGTVDANVAIAKDAARVTTEALREYLSNQNKRIDEVRRHRLLKSLKKVQMRGHTGFIGFNSTGQRINYTLYLYNHGGEDMYKKMAVWTPSGNKARERLNMTQGNDDDDVLKQSGIFPDVLKVVLVKEHPFVMNKTPNATLDNEGYEGFTIDLLEKLSEVLNFEYTIYLSPKNGYGVRRNDGTWDGMVGEIIAEKATLCMGAISITSQRESVIDFSQGIITTGYNILIAKPKEDYNIFQFLKPFSLYLWLAIIGASIFVSFVLFALDYTSLDRKFTPKETPWYAVGTLLKRGTDFSPKPVSQRVLSAGFTFFVLITVSTYTANMAAFLTNKSLEKTIRTFEDLADSSFGVCTVDKSATMKFLERKQSPMFEKIWNKVEDVKGLVPGSLKGLEFVNGKKCAFIFDYLINMYLEYQNCETKAVATPILMQEHGIGMPQGARFKTRLNIALLKLKESGFIARLKKKWWEDKRICDSNINKRAKRAQFTLSQTAGVFILALFGVCASVAFFLFKKFYLRRKMRKQARKSEKEKEKELLCKASPSSV